ncbi:DUF418 domain-containing protein [Chromobacterium violaceum]|uniref:Transporter n=1 Tax=Chromobacterium violaceum (strain ATCC 12472 / DSM 30191 / JCM 1249 / CCUG 213 / NBRC 12614 / NCIMB 9131 / NCTC 9757 / MK) TaxID=243365 RepID=Q7NV61_CHRVO|nr:DUF418 domain-containing protein [Chromobacterium violaceum]AAQ60155.1 conserved hypothetical protein [Chromobacterium violaceum ATCC 12472]SUX35684.1 Predicted membrane protein [Chromobacterium violaceum]
MNAPPNRLNGLDLARCLALIGMVMVNFRLAIAPFPSAQDPLLAWLSPLEGRSAAIFVTLAGIGLGLATARLARDQAVAQTCRRAMFLLAVGLLNFTLFPADIIHYYAFYFLAACLLLPLSGRLLLAALGLTLSSAFALQLTLDYSRGWNWGELSYVDFWTPIGFVRNLLFNGWHPMLPWLGFAIWGLWLSRQPLARPKTQWALIAGGSLLALASGLLSAWLRDLTPAPLSAFLGTKPLPPGPLYMLNAGGIASAAIGGCLLLAARPRLAARLSPLLAAGRQTLTLYIAHILIGMGVLEEMGWLDSGELARAPLAAALYCIAAAAFAWLWSRRFRHGPLESLMRRICDRQGS